MSSSEETTIDGTGEEDRNIGRVVAERYRLDELVGYGATGAVYRGTQISLERDVAIKILRGSLQFDPRSRTRFETEARAIARLRHPNCPIVHDFGYSQSIGVYYMVTEFAEGKDLSDAMETLPFDGAIQVLRDVASALAHAHDRGILHRDLKPSNIKVVRAERPLVKVLDFGLARLYDTDEVDDDERLTKAGDVFGSPAYMSPEQSRGELELTPATDVYSLGVIAFEMLESKLPFDGPSGTIVMRNHIEEDIPHMHAAHVPHGVRALIRAMLDKDPSERPAAADVVRALSPYIAGAESAALADDSTSPTDDPPEVPTSFPASVLGSNEGRIGILLGLLLGIALAAAVVRAGAFDDPPPATSEPIAGDESEKRSDPAAEPAVAEPTVDDERARRRAVDEGRRDALRTSSSARSVASKRASVSGADTTQKRTVRKLTGKDAEGPAASLSRPADDEGSDDGRDDTPRKLEFDY